MATNSNVEKIIITSTAFEDGGAIPVQYTGFDSDMSPDLHLPNIREGAVSISIIMDDLDIPLVPSYNHWLIWNIPSTQDIPPNIPYGASVNLWPGAKQGVGYGKNRYRGPKPPVFIRGTHRYVFHVYVLDCMVDLDSTARKKDLLHTMEGHILQYGNITGIWSNTYLD